MEHERQPPLEPALVNKERWHLREHEGRIAQRTHRVIQVHVSDEDGDACRIRRTTPKHQTHAVRNGSVL